MANLFRCGGGGELHGASIQVLTEESSLIGKTCDLKLGNVIIQSKVFNSSGAVLFTDIQEVGEYTVYASDGAEDTADTIIITAEDIISKTVITDYFSLRVSLILGETYSFAGYNWICAENFGTEYAVLQSVDDVTQGTYPGYKMSGTLYGRRADTDVTVALTKSTFNGDSNYFYGNVDGCDISNYDSKMSDLYALIDKSEYRTPTYGKGLFLINLSKVGYTGSGSMQQGSGLYWQALKNAALKDKYGSNVLFSWIGIYYGLSNNNQSAWIVRYDGVVGHDGVGENGPHVIAPAFNVDLSKIRLTSATSIAVK